jgi:hypothetical protein
MNEDGEIRMLRHALATLAYRAEKPLRDAPKSFAAHRAGDTTRTPLELVGHLGDLMDWACHLADGHWTWRADSNGDWERDVERFFASLGRLDARLAAGEPPKFSAKVIFQGPVADALTHVGQLALLRGHAGAPVTPESFGRAEIAVGRVGRDQSKKRTEFEGDASAKG